LREGRISTTKRAWKRLRTGDKSRPIPEFLGPEFLKLPETLKALGVDQSPWIGVFSALNQTTKPKV
jgi:hypothetical protein